MAKRKPDPMPQSDFFALWDKPAVSDKEPEAVQPIPRSPLTVAAPEAVPAHLSPTAEPMANVTANENKATGQGEAVPALPSRPPGSRRGPKPGGATFGRELGRLDARLLLRPPELAEMLGLTPSTLAKMRCTGTGPPFYKLTNQSVGYRRDEVMDWIDQRRRQSTWSG